jgi:hypothetical protein
MFDVRHGDDRGPAAMDADNPAVVRSAVSNADSTTWRMAWSRPSRVKDEMLWLCPMCQSIVGGQWRGDSRELEQRIRDDIQ